MKRPSIEWIRMAIAASLVALIGAGIAWSALVGPAGNASDRAVVAAVPLPATSAAQMTAKALAFLKLLNGAETAKVSASLTSNERGWWNNVPPAGVQRAGLRVGDLNDAQRIAFHELLQASLSSQGYLKVSGIMHLEPQWEASLTKPPPGAIGYDNGDFWSGPVATAPPFSEAMLKAMERIHAESVRLAGKRGTDAVWDGMDYFITVFGTPTSVGNWAWLVTGHHLAATFTVSQGRVAFTPLFLGASPAVIRKGIEAGWSVLHQESVRGVELMNSLTPQQRRVAWVSPDHVYQVLAGPGRRDSLKQYEGLQANALDAGQKRLLRVLVEEYVRDADFDSADAQLAAIDTAGWDNLHFSWHGPVGDEDSMFYYRVHGPRILIEVAWEARNHIHSIVRDPGNDYGEDWLRAHYVEQAPDMTEVNADAADLVIRSEKASLPQ